AQGDAELQQRVRGLRLGQLERVGDLSCHLRRPPQGLPGGLCHERLDGVDHLRALLLRPL
ncbi:unnamed protein product, partial [Effrenium voratum]